MTEKTKGISAMRTLHIFGGGELLGVAERLALEAGWKVVVRTGKRFENTLPTLHSTTRVYVGDSLTQLMHEGGEPRSGDCGFSFSAPWVFTQDVIDMFAGNIFNLHNQPLPKFRGAGGTSWLILMNERKGGCCIHRLVRKIDAGAIYARLDFEFPDGCRYPVDFDAYIFDRSEDLVSSWLPNLLEIGGPGAELAIDESESEYWPRLNTDAHGWVDWSWGIVDIEAFCNAFSFPHAGAKTMIRGSVVRLKSVKAVAGTRKYHPFQRGLVFRIERDGELAVAHPEGALQILGYDMENETLKPRLGDRFFTPIDRLTVAMTRRVQYLPSGEIIDN